MGFFADQELENADVDPFSMPLGENKVFVKEAKLLTLKNDNSQAFVITYAMADAPDRTHQEWLKNPKADDKDVVRRLKLAKNKKILLELGVEDSKEALGSVEPEDLVGITGILDLYKKGQWVQYGKFTVTDDSVDFEPSATPDEVPTPDVKDEGFDF